ncbi:hypothetical protein QBC39DRAFT_430882 [Podospora conica]|nr:hypothetical protein QBC39DRAFT_430882 [Schizothecium conicum]
MVSSTYHVLRQEPASAELPGSHPVDNITWIYVAVGIVPVVFLCSGIVHYIRTHRRKKLQADKAVDIEMHPGVVQFARDLDDDIKITKVTGNPNSVWNQMGFMKAAQRASTNFRTSCRPSLNIYANDHGARFGDITRSQVSLVQPPAPAANPPRRTGGKTDVLRPVMSVPVPDAPPRPPSSVYSQNHAESAPVAPMPAISETDGSPFDEDAELNRILNARVLGPADYDERRQALFEASERKRRAQQQTAERPASLRKGSYEERRRRQSPIRKQRKRRSSGEYGRPALVQGGWERRKKDSQRRRQRRSSLPAERDRLEPGARRSGLELERHRSDRRPRKDEKPPRWLDRLAQRLVTGTASM